MKPLADGFLYASAEAALRYALGSGAGRSSKKCS